MSPNTTDRDALHLAENPAIEFFQSFGYAHIAPDGRDPERTIFTEPMITSRLAAALERLDPRLSDTNLT